MNVSLFLNHRVNLLPSIAAKYFTSPVTNIRFSSFSCSLSSWILLRHSPHYSELGGLKADVSYPYFLIASFAFASELLMLFTPRNGSRVLLTRPLTRSPSIQIRLRQYKTKANTPDATSSPSGRLKILLALTATSTGVLFAMVSTQQSVKWILS